MKLSAVVITKNESVQIEAAITSLLWCDEIVVVDSGSSDDTVAKARQLGARVIYHEFAGFGDQKAFAVASASNDWILSIDADEVVSPELAEEIQSLDLSTEIKGYTIRRIDQFQGRLLNHSLGARSSILRLFDRRAGTFNRNRVHESVELNGSVKSLRAPLFHTPYRSLDLYFDKFNRYTSLMAEQRYERGKRVTALGVLIRYPFALFDSIVLKRGFLDGYQGVLMGLFHALYTATKYAKLKELNDRNNHSAR